MINSYSASRLLTLTGMTLILGFSSASNGQVAAAKSNTKRIDASKFWDKAEEQVEKFLGKPTTRVVKRFRKSNGDYKDYDFVLLTFNKPNSKVSQLEIGISSPPSKKGTVSSIIAWVNSEKASSGLWNVLGIVPETGGKQSEASGGNSSGSFSTLLQFESDPAFKVFGGRQSIYAEVSKITGPNAHVPAENPKPEGTIFLSIIKKG